MTQPAAASDLDGDDSHEYHPVEPWAILALVLGLAAPLALVDPLLSLIPALGLLAALVALARLASDPLRPGRRGAQLGLAMSAVFVMVPLAHYGSAHWLLARQGRPTADQFLEFLRQRSPEKAVLLTLGADARPPIDDGLWSHFRNDATAQQMLLEMLDNAPIRMLLSLGDKADIRFYKTNAVAAGKSLALVDYWYTVTFTDGAGRKKTILLGLLMERKQASDATLSPWRVKDISINLASPSSRR